MENQESLVAKNKCTKKETKKKKTDYLGQKVTRPPITTPPVLRPINDLHQSEFCGKLHIRSQTKTSGSSSV